ncbi:MAG TPA: NAD(P)-dependent oxidoreductase, partial [Alphaproteobacteria bacterium]
MTDQTSALHVTLLENIHPQASALFREKGLSNIETHKPALDGAALEKVMRESHLLGLRSKTHVRAPELQKAKHLEAIGCFCIGTDQVDLATATKMGIPVFNAPYANTRSVAELVLGQIIMLMRRIPEKSAAAHRGEWLKGIDGACEVRGKVLGIIGYGHIGTQLSVLAEALGMRVMFYDVIDKLALGNAQRALSLEQLLNHADVVTLHVPATKQTENMINAETLAMMKKGAYLINASRGKVVDLHA